MAEVASAYVSLVPSARGFGRATERQVGGEVRTSGKRLGRSFGSAMKLGAGAVLAGGFAAASLLKSSLGEAREAQKVGAQTNAVIKSTGGAANVTAKQIGDLSTAISNKVGIDDEVIQSGANMLLTFKNVRNEAGKGNDIFNQSTQILTDMSTAMGTEPRQAAIQLGKALNDPVKGITALSRVGVTFTAQQKKTIKSLVASGKTMDAQKIILRELNSEFGGSAAAQATAADKAKVAWGNLKEQIGTALLPIVDRLATFITGKVVPAISTFISQMQDGTGTGGKVADVLGKVADVLGVVFGFISRNKTVLAVFLGTIYAIAAATAAWNAILALNPLSLVVIAVAALAAGLVYAYKHSETFRKVVNTAFHAVGEAGRWLWNNALRPAFLFIGKGLGIIMLGWSKMLHALGHVPGFGWAKKAGDKMEAAGHSAMNLGDKIGKIPAHKNTNVTADTRQPHGALNGVIAQLAQIKDKKVRVQVETWMSNVTRNLSPQALFGGARAVGGPVQQGTTYLVGENGPELFTASQSGHIIPNNRLDGSGGGTAGAVAAGQRLRLVVDGREFHAYVDDRADGRVAAQSSLSAQTSRGGPV